MKKIMIVVCAAVVVLVIALCVWKSLHKGETLCAVTYRNEFGYSLSMEANDGHITVTYLDEGSDPAVKEVDGSCYEDIADILRMYDFPSWKDLSDREAASVGFDTLEIRYADGKTFFFSEAQELPEKAQEVFSVINTCLLEYAEIFK